MAAPFWRSPEGRSDFWFFRSAVDEGAVFLIRRRPSIPGLPPPRSSGRFEHCSEGVEPPAPSPADRAAAALGSRGPRSHHGRACLSDARPTPKFKTYPQNQKKPPPPHQTASDVYLAGAWRAKPDRLLRAGYSGRRRLMAASWAGERRRRGTRRAASVIRKSQSSSVGGP